ncbi:hypothetical protein ACVI1L_001653 [Bradyrhizobium sp. USDA 4516]
MAHNQHQIFGFRNEARAPSPAGNAGSALGVMMTIGSGDALDVLPPAARERVEQMKLRAEECSALYRENFASEQAVRADIFGIEARIAELQRPRGAGGADLDDTDIRVVTEQRRLDQKRADLGRLLDAQATRTVESQRLGELLRSIETAISDRPRGTVAQMVEVGMPPFKGNILDAIEGRRRRLRELQADLQRTRCSPWPSSLARQKMRADIEALAETGRPNASAAIEHNSSIGWPTAQHRVDVHNSPGAVGFAQMPDTLALFAWLHRDALIAALDREIDECADDDEALTAEQRREREIEIERDMLATAREEVALINLAKKQGVPADHRVDCSPLAILQIEWVTAPPPATREGVGEAGLARTIGP